MEAKLNIKYESKLVDCQGLGGSLVQEHIEFESCDFENPQHLEALAELTNHYMEDPMGDFPPLNKIRQLRLIDGLANHPSAQVFFAIIENKVVGLATCFVNFSTFHVKSYLYIHDIVVIKKFRNKGIGKALMQFLIKISTERNYCKITLEVREDNFVAQSLYSELGFEDCNPKMLFWTKKLAD